MNACKCCTPSAQLITEIEDLIRQPELGVAGRVDAHEDESDDMGLLPFQEEAEVESESSGPIECVYGPAPGSNPTILHCFPAHVTDLTDLHREHLGKIADEIKRSLPGRRPITRVRIVGHASTWRGIKDKKVYAQRAMDRAKNAKSFLISKLGRSARKVRITIEHRADDDPLPGIDNMPNSTSRKARNNRSLNRRVVISRFRTTKPPKKKKPKKKTCRSPDIIKLIRRANVSILTNIPNERKQLVCLRKFIADKLSGKRLDDTFWTFTVVGGGSHGSGHAVTRDTKMLKAADFFCKSLSGKKLTPTNLSRALNKTHNKILSGIEKLDRFFSGIPKGSPFTGDPVKGFTECGFAKSIASKSTTTNSVYKCYSKVIKKRFSRCMK